MNLEIFISVLRHRVTIDKQVKLETFQSYWKSNNLTNEPLKTVPYDMRSLHSRYLEIKHEFQNFKGITSHGDLNIHFLQTLICPFANLVQLFPRWLALCVHQLRSLGVGGGGVVW